VGHSKVGQILHEMHYSLQGNRKTEEGNDNPDRDAQFRHINDTVKRNLARGWPVISVDTKRKELLGNYHKGVALLDFVNFSGIGGIRVS
jgi:hypothetical protein